MASTDTHDGGKLSPPPTQTALEEEGTTEALREAHGRKPRLPLGTSGFPAGPALKGSTRRRERRERAAEHAHRRQGRRRARLGGHGLRGLSTQSASLFFVLSSVGTFSSRKLASSSGSFVSRAHSVHSPHCNVSIYLDAHPDHSAHPTAGPSA